MEEKTFFRVGHKSTNQGLWYGSDGEFTGLIHTIFDFCKNSKLKMPFDIDIVGWLSATETLEELFEWFPSDDIAKLESYGFFITEYRSTEYRFKDNHWVIRDRSSVKVKHHLLNELNVPVL